MGGIGFGVPELMIVLILFFTSVIPLIAAIWAMVMLYRVRVDQQAIRRILESLERRLPVVLFCFAALHPAAAATPPVPSISEPMVISGTVVADGR